MAWHQVKTRVIIGILLILLGTLFVLRNLDIYFIPDELISWQYFFILFGLLLFFLANNKTAGAIFIALGLFNLVPELWPLVFVFIGLYIILRRRDHHIKRVNFTHHVANEPQDKTQDYCDDVSIFGGGSKVFFSDNFRGGTIVSIFGGSEINLTQCKLVDGENILDITAIFGGSTILVPTDWKVEVDVLPIFGGFSDKRRKDPNIAYQPGKILIVKGLVIFGGGEIKN
ncbi:MAG: LiaF domain-containing protein [Bacteroidota bacterium]